jgi:hypothetical protein
MMTFVCDKTLVSVDHVNTLKSKSFLAITQFKRSGIKRSSATRRLVQ